ncbi:hypothetical protein SCHPADRAFT_948231 [Schizopora paradoxa]|uniref:Uncharacterized protein n=1 Tax=Schizopora paradoxa TaxID=27342 RepID=A0A0H2QX12_9AGAM|nr:hypothetical protein SCHPADRAFT_948231 [Schizopora paradoxa]
MLQEYLSRAMSVSVEWSSDDAQLLLTRFASMFGAGIIILVLARGASLLLKLVLTLVHLLVLLLSAIVKAISGGLQGIGGAGAHETESECPGPALGGEFYRDGFQYNLSHTFDFRSDLHSYHLGVPRVPNPTSTVNPQSSFRFQVLTLVDALLFMTIWIGIICNMKESHDLMLRVKTFILGG